MSNEMTQELIDQRSAIYGDPTATFVRVAAIWSALLDHTVQSWEVPILMMALKMIRVTQAPDYSDNSDDIEGYLDIFRRLMSTEMVHARSVNEYIEKRSH